MSKTILVLHGWPQYKLDDHFLNIYLGEKGYKVICPNLFDSAFEFSKTELVRRITVLLKGETPDGIIGISMGGLLLPDIAVKFPKAKLIFIASAAKLGSNSKIFNLAIKLAHRPFAARIMERLLRLPDNQFEKLYKFINPFHGQKSDYIGYQRDTKSNVKFIKSIPVKKELEIIDFVKNTSNTDILSKMKNKALIFSGEEDMFMPSLRGEELRGLLVNSQLIMNCGEHFNVFGPRDLDLVEDFLK